MEWDDDEACRESAANEVEAVTDDPELEMRLYRNSASCCSLSATSSRKLARSNTNCSSLTSFLVIRKPTVDEIRLSCSEQSSISRCQRGAHN